MNKSYCPAVDIVKLLCCISITMLHCDFFFGNKDAGWYLTSYASGPAVAFFFVASGYFFAQKVRNNEDNLWEMTKRYCVRLLIPLIFWDIINFCVSMINAVRNSLPLGKQALHGIKLILVSPPGAMWYVQALIIGILIWYFFIKKRRILTGMLISVVLYFVGALGNSYYFLIENTYIGKITLKYSKIFENTRNGLFVGFCLVGLGIVISYYDSKFNDKKMLMSILAVLSLMLLILEVRMVNGNITLDNHSLYFFTLVFIPATFILLKSINLENSKVLKISKVCRKMSTGIYFSHVPMVPVTMVIMSIVGIKAEFGIILWIINTIMCIILCVTAMKINNKWINKVL